MLGLCTRCAAALVSKSCMLGGGGRGGLRARVLGGDAWVRMGVQRDTDGQEGIIPTRKNKACEASQDRESVRVRRGTNSPAKVKELVRRCIVTLLMTFQRVL